MSDASRTLRSASVAETLDFGRRIGVAIRSGWVVALIGELGVGKTHLVKGIAAGNWTGEGPAPEVTSPTFVLVNEYAGRVKLFHLDAYRLKGAGDLEALGVAEMADHGAVLVEWADRASAALPADRLTITGRTTGETAREWRLEAGGPSSNLWLNTIQ